MPLRRVREAVAVGAPLVLVPAGADAGVEPAVAGHVDRRGDLGVEGRVAVAVAADHLPDVHALVSRASAAVIVQHSKVVSSVGSGTVWKWS